MIRFVFAVKKVSGVRPRIVRKPGRYVLEMKMRVSVLMRLSFRTVSRVQRVAWVLRFVSV